MVFFIRKDLEGDYIPEHSVQISFSIGDQVINFLDNDVLTHHYLSFSCQGSLHIYILGIYILSLFQVLLSWKCDLLLLLQVILFYVKLPLDVLSWYTMNSYKAMFMHSPLLNSYYSVASCQFSTLRTWLHGWITRLHRSDNFPYHCQNLLTMFHSKWSSLLC